MKRILLGVSFLFLLIFMSCQPQDTPIVNNPTDNRTAIFNTTYGSSVSDVVTGARQCFDGGVVICGYTIASAFGDNDIFVTKLDDSSNVVWSKIIGGAGNDIAVYMDTTFDGGFIICGSSTSFSSAFDPIAIKIDNSGNIVWAMAYSGTLDDQGFYITPTADFGYIMTGSTNSAGAGAFDIFALKIDGSGEVLWQNNYGGTVDDYGIAIRSTPDGGYIIAGNSQSFGSAGEIYAIKIYGDGVLNWSKTYGSTGTDMAKDVIATSGGFVICGSTTSFGVSIEDGYVLSGDNNGTLLWSRTFSGLLAQDDRFLSMKIIPEGGIIIAGSMKNVGGNNEDFCLLRLFNDGAFNWMKSFGGTGADIGTTAAMKFDGGFLIAGTTTSFGAGANDAYVISLKSDGKGCGTDSPVTPVGGNPMTETINPLTVSTAFEFASGTAGLNVGDFNHAKTTQCLTGP